MDGACSFADLRARTLDGAELRLPSRTAFAAEDPLDERAVHRMLVAVMTRRYARSLEPLGAPWPVGRRFVASARKHSAATSTDSTSPSPR